MDWWIHEDMGYITALTSRKIMETFRSKVKSQKETLEIESLEDPYIDMSGHKKVNAWIAHLEFNLQEMKCIPYVSSQISKNQSRTKIKLEYPDT